MHGPHPARGPGTGNGNGASQYDHHLWLGSKFFDLIGKPDLRPEWLAPLPAFSRDKLDDAWGEADIVLQLCADDPTTLAHATRHMIRAGVDYVATRWMQQGFLSAHGAHSAGETPRNLFGLKDGTVNPRSDADFDDIVWIDQGPSWCREVPA